VLDVFLESFPFGCGLTGIQGLEAGTPFLSYEASETQYGMHFMRPLAENGAAAQKIRSLLQPTDGSGPLLYAANADEYVALAAKLARDADFRRKVGAAGQAYYRRYLTDSDRMARRFMQVLAEVKHPGEGPS
jgi:predicted O-linked N-acetylglucosamine transferase (SPINDLY family)